MMGADPQSAPIVHLGDVGSTNDEAMARLRATASPLWVIADRQVAGRGRRGRPWVSEPGNLYASFAFSPTWSETAFGLLPLAAAVALADAVDSLGVSARVKWPNDVLVNGLKVSGILIESEWVGTVRRVVVGFGVNVTHHPTAAPSAHLAEFQPNIDVAMMQGALLPAFADVLEALGRPDGVESVRQRWLDRAAGIGQPIDVRLEAETRSGVFEGLDADGHLILRHADDTSERIAAGDVFLRAAS
ncbi:biotin--[acetyl-CoA-carboxylase] ligase [Acuticoccus sediminis]|uniref:biotin--[acetyl-CoA-carboxylase] ligase n=1 Tax=Acuticoccus sediminis TaxID=2184697 RepID=UPI001CFED534|nr:biotin--[acetyl-CoA-carboxylase] ligase [Acuticoccus sediminis]